MDAYNTTALEHLQKELTSSIRWDLNVVKSIKKDKFHFTILFLGEIHKDIIERITEKLLRVEFSLKKQVRIDFDNLSNLMKSRTFGAETMDIFHLKKSDLTSQGRIYSNILSVYAK
jgi:2'-5' RNA ligase